MELPISPVEKMLKRSRLRVSKDAAKEFAIFLEETIADISAEADAISKRAGRKTVTEKDIRIVEAKLK